MVSTIFDPIELLAPFVIQLRVILQNLWKQGQTWDQTVPADLQPRINKFATQNANMPDLLAVPSNSASALLCRTSHIHRRFHLRILRRYLRTSTAV